MDTEPLDLPPAGRADPTVAPSAGSAPPPPGAGRGLERALLWSLLAAVLLGVAVASLVGVLRGPGHLATGAARPAPPPRYAVVPDFALIDQDGAPVGRASLVGRPWVADFIFTRCAVSCPRMTATMLRLRARLAERASGAAGASVRLVSISVDPAHDTPEVLAAYARGHGISGTDWRFLTGEPAAVRELVREGFLLAVEDAPPDAPGRADEPITHSSRFVLVDAAGTIRGYYDAFEPDGLDRLMGDLSALDTR